MVHNIKYSIVALFIIGLMACTGGSPDTNNVAKASVVDGAKSKLTIEKPQLTFGFIKLTDMAPLAIAKELGYFKDEGLYVSIEAQSNWKNVLDRVIDGQLDGSHMLAVSKTATPNSHLD